MADTVFQRKEVKYLLTLQQRDALYARIRAKVRPDQYQQYTIGNVYFDTATDELVRASIEGPVYKEKLRMRSYGVPGPGDVVFLEMKKKYDGIVYKRRALLGLRDAERYVLGGGREGYEGQIFRELDYFLDFYRPVPRLYLAYDRAAFCGREEPDLRITFDERIRSRTEELSLGAGDWGEELLPKDSALMEIKAAGALPLWLTRALSAEGLYPSSFSKYGAVYKLGLAHAV